MPRVSNEYMARRREEILEAAKGCFAREGFHATSMRDIYRECGLSPGAVYNHFASKDEIVRSLGEERLREAQARREALELIEDPVEALRLMAAGAREQLMREEDLVLDLQLASEALRNESIAEVSRQTFYATLEHEEILVSTMAGRAKAKAVERSPKVSLCVLDEQWPPSYLQVYCDATVDTEFDRVVEVMMSIAGVMAGNPMPEDVRPMVEEG